MKLWKHFLVCTIIAALLYPQFEIISLLVFVGGFFIDIDHPLFYFIKYKSINFIKAYNYFSKIGSTKDTEEYHKVTRYFHNIETFLIIAFLSFFSQYYLMIIIGMTAHFIMDIYEERNLFGSIRNYSIIYNLIKKQKAL